ncbi:MAG: hypothetical protein ACYC7D_05555 [Nitrososphaerales archaeon]
MAQSPSNQIALGSAKHHPIPNPAFAGYKVISKGRIKLSGVTGTFVAPAVSCGSSFYLLLIGLSIVVKKGLIGGGFLGVVANCNGGALLYNGTNSVTTSATGAFPVKAGDVIVVTWQRTSGGVTASVVDETSGLQNTSSLSGNIEIKQASFGVSAFGTIPHYGSVAFSNVGGTVASSSLSLLQLKPHVYEMVSSSNTVIAIPTALVSAAPSSFAVDQLPTS